MMTFSMPGLKPLSLTSEPYLFSKNHGVLVVEVTDTYADVIYHPECNINAIFELRRHLDMPLRLTEVSLQVFSERLTKKYEIDPANAYQAAEDLGDNLDLQQLIPQTADLLETENDAPVIRLINALLREAIKQKASDLHFEPFETSFMIRFRIDGVLQNILEVPYLLSPLLISRIKVMAKLDISEKRLPQDGRISVRIADRVIDVRVSTIPVIHGERGVLRLLDKQSSPLDLEKLGIRSMLLSIVRRMIAKPNGILLVTGPTGSGKTTTLYGMLTELNTPGKNIITIEDPVEYDLPGISQIQVNPKIEMSFARGLRAILRQDPNVVMVGEIRDVETALIAVQASLTGHLVLSTLHTNSAIGAITRLRDMGVESFLLASSLNGVIAQRLVRLLCVACKAPYLPTVEELARLNATEEITLYKPQGCSQCNRTGYSGRIGIYEIIEIDSTLKAMIHEDMSERELDIYAKQKLPTMWQDGALRVLKGETSLDELIRMTSD